MALHFFIFKFLVLVSWQQVINHFSNASEIACTERSINIPTQLYKILLATTDMKMTGS